MTAAERWRAVPRASGRALSEPLLLTILIACATVLRLPLWFANHPLHHDEALYGSWARLIASGRDPWLLTSWVDKPPLVLYLQATALRLFGPAEMALRLPGMIAGIIVVPLVYGFGLRAYGRGTALLAATLFGACAFAIQFSPTAFTDPWLVVFILASCWAALAGRSFLAGLAAGLAVASKQQGLLVIPLTLTLLALAQTQREGRFRPLHYLGYAFLPALFGFALIFAPVTWWDSLRWAKRPSFWERSLATYGGLHVAGVAQWPARMADWMTPLRYLFGPPLVTALIGGMAAIAVAASLRRGGSIMDRLLGAYVIGFFALHVVLTFQPWDRYLLPLTPFVTLLAARGIMAVVGSRLPSPTRTLTLTLSPWERGLATVIIAAAVAWGAISGMLGQLPVGSGHGAYGGVKALAMELRELPPGAALYYRSLGWHYGYYLFDAPVERRWWGSAWKLAADAAQLAREEPGRGQWVVLPPSDSGAEQEIQTALATQTLTLTDAQRLPMANGEAAWLYHIAPASTP